jgi:hypothetical protein
LEVSGQNDGCALFVRSSTLRVLSCETTTLALSIAGLSDSGELIEDDKRIQAQNQVGLIAVCDFIDVDTATPPVIICTTHLKSSKSATGERYRQKGIVQFLDEVDKIYRSLEVMGRRPTVVLTGDFNASPFKNEYAEPLTYRAVKAHRLALRSIYNEDVQLSKVSLSCKDDIYTTWKARRSSTVTVSDTNIEPNEVIGKRCSDYIFYGPYTTSPFVKNLDSGSNGVARSDVVAFTDSQVFTSYLLRFSVYFFAAIIPATSIISSTLSIYDRICVVSLSIIGLSIFEISTEGTVFKPRVAARWARFFKDEIPFGGPVGSLGKGMQIIKNKTSLSDDAYPGIRAVAALDIFSPEDIGPDLMPSKEYPSDHLSLVADLSLVF